MKLDQELKTFIEHNREYLTDSNLETLYKASEVISNLESEIRTITLPDLDFIDDVIETLTNEILSKTSDEYSEFLESLISLFYSSVAPTDIKIRTQKWIFREYNYLRTKCLITDNGNYISIVNKSLL